MTIDDSGAPGEIPFSQAWRMVHASEGDRLLKEAESPKSSLEEVSVLLKLAELHYQAANL